MSAATIDPRVMTGTLTLTTHEGGKARGHLLKCVGGMTVTRVVAYIIIGLFAIITAGRLLFMDIKIDAVLFFAWGLFIVGMTYFSLGVFFGAYSFLALKSETIRLFQNRISIEGRNGTLEALWSDIREVKVSYTSWFSVFYLGGIPGEKTPVVYITARNWKHTIEWWRYPIEERKAAFQFIFLHAMQHNVRIVDDFTWVPLEHANYKYLSSEAKSEYGNLKKAGLVIMGIGGLVTLIGIAAGRGDIAAVGIAPIFIGFMCWVAGAAGESEIKKKKERQLAEQLLK